MEKKLTYEELELKVKVLEQEKMINKVLKKDLSQTNKLLTLLIDTMPNPMFYKDINGIYQKCNNAFSKMILGIPKEHIIGKTLFDLPEVIPPELAMIYKKQDDKLFNHPGTQFYEGEVLCSDNKRRTFIFYKATLENEYQELIGLVGIMLDITELRENQQELSDKNKELERISTIDALTNINNRRNFDEKLLFMMQHLPKSSLIINFAILDVDDFKQYNDTFGHQEGDNVLVKVANVLKKSFHRSSDYYFRLGGEEFGMMFFSKNAQLAYEQLERIRTQIEALHSNYTYIKKNITISSGLISFDSNKFTVNEIYNQTDTLLYEAKNNGKNQTVAKILK